MTTTTPTSTMTILKKKMMTMMLESSKTTSFLASISSLSWKLQVWYLLFFITSMKLIQLKAVANFIDFYMLGWMDSTRQDVHDFVKMTYHCWFFHYTMMCVGIEMITALSYSKQTKQEKNTKEKNLQYTMYYIFLINAIQGHVTCLSHACIDLHPTLENKLNTLAYGLFLPTAVFLTGIIAILPNKQQDLGWYIFTPIMAYLTYNKYIGFHNILGRVLSTLSLLVVLTSNSKQQGLKLVFKVGYMLLSMTPMLPVDDGSDKGHTNVAIFITILQLMLLFGIEPQHEENVVGSNEGSHNIQNKKKE